MNYDYKRRGLVTLTLKKEDIKEVIGSAKRRSPEPLHNSDEQGCTSSWNLNPPKLRDESLLQYHVANAELIMMPSLTSEWT